MYLTNVFYHCVFFLMLNCPFLEICYLNAFLKFFSFLLINVCMISRILMLSNFHKTRNLVKFIILCPSLSLQKIFSHLFFHCEHCQFKTILYFYFSPKCLERICFLSFISGLKQAQGFLVYLMKLWHVDEASFKIF